MGYRRPGPFGTGYYHDPFDPFIHWWTLGFTSLVPKGQVSRGPRVSEMK